MAQDPGLGTNYTRLLTAAAVSRLGDGVRLTELPLLAASLTRNPAAVAGVALAGQLPWLLFALIGGAVADRVDWRRLMAGVDFLRSLLVGSLALSLVLGAGSLSLLYIVSFTLGTCETLFDNAAHAILPSVVRREHLGIANSRLEAVDLVGGLLIGPILGGILFAAARAVPFALDASTFLIGASVLSTMPGVFRASAPHVASRPTLVADAREGLVWLWRNPAIRTMSLIAGVVNLVLNAGFLSLFVLYSIEVLRVDGAGFGLLMSVYAVGGLAATFLAPWLGRTLGRTRATSLAILMAATAHLVVGASASPVLTGLMLVLLAVAGAVWNVVSVSWRQSLVPDRLLGRVNSAFRLISLGASSFGVLLGGLLSRQLGLRAPFLAGGVVLVLAAFLAGATLGRSERRASPDQPTRSSKPPAAEM